MNKTAIQFEEGDCLIDKEGRRLEVAGGAWMWSRYADESYYEVTDAEQAILDKLTEIVKPLRMHKIVDDIYREDGYGKFGGHPTWERLAGLQKQVDLFVSWGWPIPAHMEEDK